MKFVIIGITDQPKPSFTPEITAAIRHGRLFSGGRRHHEIVAPLLPDGAVWVDITSPIDAVLDRYEAACQTLGEDHVVVFASGDPLFFGFANTIRRERPQAEVTLFPTFNALQMLAHRLLMPYHDMRIVSLTGRPWPEMDRALIEQANKIGVLTDRQHTPAAIAQRMTEYGYNDYELYVGEHIGNPALERVGRYTPEEAARTSFSMPNCIIMQRKDGGRQRPFGIPDSDFALLDGRERMITKMPIRLLTLQALDLPRRHTLWDIGFCTGSVSIEARLRFPHLNIRAYEVRPECEAIIHENMRRHGAPGIEVCMGDFITVCPQRRDGDDNSSPTATPDAVFIGGHGGQLVRIMERVLQHMGSDGIIVMNSVNAQSRALWNEACLQLRLRQMPEMQITINEYNTITILKCQR